MSAYAELEARFRRMGALNGAAAMLHWDNAVMMPEGAAEVRAEQLATLATVAHEQLTHPALPELLDKATDETLDNWQQANLREMQLRYLHANAVEGALVEALAKARAASEHVWRSARKENDYARFLPYFEEVLSLVKQEAAAKAEALKLSPYDALLDAYDPGTRSAEIDTLFAELESFLPELVTKVIEHQARQPAPLPLGEHFPVEQQAAIGRRFMDALGFDFNHGRIDVSHHPFCGGVPGDVRLTTRYDESDFSESLMGVLHETGHALYEMGLPEQWHMQPVGDARGMSLHESQSLFIEMQISRSRDFLRYSLPIIREVFGASGEAWEEENVHRNLTRVKRSLIRVNADEVTYPLHIILRYRLEKQLLCGELAPVDLPEAWDAAMQELLGIKPDCVGNGCMQDIHWPDGSIGYFPTYTLGAMIAAQLFATAREALPDLSEHLQQGRFAMLIQWLKTHVHSRASLLSTPDLVQQATGKPLDVTIYRAHLESRYLA